MGHLFGIALHTIWAFTCTCRTQTDVEKFKTNSVECVLFSIRFWSQVDHDVNKTTITYAAINRVSSTLGHQVNCCISWRHSIIYALICPWWSYLTILPSYWSPPMSTQNETLECTSDTHRSHYRNSIELSQAHKPTPDYNCSIRTRASRTLTDSVQLVTAICSHLMNNPANYAIPGSDLNVLVVCAVQMEL